MGLVGLGRFGDRRLEKGGPFCTGGWWRGAPRGFEYAGSAEIGLAKSA
jgi:hypothetical protein